MSEWDQRVPLRIWVKPYESFIDKLHNFTLDQRSEGPGFGAAEVARLHE